MSLQPVDRLSYQEPRTAKGNPYRECHTYSNAGLIAPIILDTVGTGFSSFFEYGIRGILNKCKVPEGKFKVLTFVLGIAIDVYIFASIGKLIDKMITKRRMKKADKLAEKNNVNVMG